MNPTIKYYNDIEQRSQQWYELRLGKLTASKMNDIIDYKTGCLKSDYNKDGSFKVQTPIITAISGVIAEIQTGFSNDMDFVSDAMEWGTDNEMIRIEQIKNKNTFQTGFVTNSRFKYFGLSPDLLEANKGVVIKGTEIKCPNSKTYASWVIKNEIPSKHLVQVMSYFVAIPTLKIMDFDIFDPRFKGKKSHTITINRCDMLGYIANMEQALIDFEKMVDEKLKLFK